MRQMIQLAWQSFRPQDRASLDQPVAYQAVYYGPQAKTFMRRLESGFYQSLCQLRDKQPRSVPGDAIYLGR